MCVHCVHCVHWVLTWDVVDGDGENQEKNSSPAASCPCPLFLGFTLSFLAVRGARMRSFSSLIHVAILYFICVRERNRNNHRGNRSYGLSLTERNHLYHEAESMMGLNWFPFRLLFIYFFTLIANQNRFSKWRCVFFETAVCKGLNLT